MKKLLIVLVLVLVAYATLLAGVEWKATTEFTGESAKAGNKTVMTVQAQGGNMKQIFESVSNESPLYRQGDYWLYRSADNILYNVSPADKSYWEMPLDYLFKMTQAVGKIVKIKIKNPKITKETLSPGTVLGISCLHYKLVLEYDMEVKVAFIKKGSHEIQEKEVWSSPQIKGLNEIAMSFRQKDYKTGIEDLDALIEEQLKAEGNTGFPLRVITITSSVNKKGEAKEKSRTVMEVTHLESKTFPASNFEIPAGYQKKEMAKSPFGE